MQNTSIGTSFSSEDLRQFQHRVVSPLWRTAEHDALRNGFRRSNPLKLPNPLVVSSQRAKSSYPQRTFTDFITDIYVPAPVQIPQDEYNYERSTTCQSFHSTSKLAFVPLPNLSDESQSKGVRPLTSHNIRVLPLCGERYTVTPFRQECPKIIKSKGRPKSVQQSRFDNELNALSRCRLLKRTSEVRAHRIDRMYALTGSPLNPVSKYDSESSRVEKLKAIQEAARSGTLPVERHKRYLSPDASIQFQKQPFNISTSGMPLSPRRKQHNQNVISQPPEINNEVSHAYNNSVFITEKNVIIVKDKQRINSGTKTGGVKESSPGGLVFAIQSGQEEALDVHEDNTAEVHEDNAQVLEKSKVAHEAVKDTDRNSLASNNDDAQHDEEDEQQHQVDETLETEEDSHDVDQNDDQDSVSKTNADQISSAVEIPLDHITEDGVTNTFDENETLISERQDNIVTENNEQVSESLKNLDTDLAKTDKEVTKNSISADNNTTESAKENILSKTENSTSETDVATKTNLENVISSEILAQDSSQKTENSIDVVVNKDSDKLLDSKSDLNAQDTLSKSENSSPVVDELENSNAKSSAVSLAQDGLSSTENFVAPTVGTVEKDNLNKQLDTEKTNSDKNNLEQPSRDFVDLDTKEHNNNHSSQKSSEIPILNNTDKSNTSVLATAKPIHNHHNKVKMHNLLTRPVTVEFRKPDNSTVANKAKSMSDFNITRISMLFSASLKMGLSSNKQETNTNITVGKTEAQVGTANIDEEDTDSENEEDLDDEDEGADLTDEEVLKMLDSGDIKLDFDKSVFNGVKYKPKEVRNQSDKRAQFREVTKHLVVKQELTGKDTNEILYIEPNMTPEQAAAFTSLFDSFDINKDGRLGLDEIKRSLSGVIKVTKKQDVNKFLRVFDLNGDRTIDVREFLAVAALNDSLCKQKTTDPKGLKWKLDLDKCAYYITVYKEMFQLADANNSGKLNLEELMLVVASGLDQETGTNVELIEDILRSIDRDHSGSIDFVEYLTYIPVFLKLHQFFMKKPMLIEDIENSRRMIRKALCQKKH